MEDVDHLTARGFAEKGEDCMLLALDDTPLSHRFSGPRYKWNRGNLQRQEGQQKFIMTDLCIENIPALPKTMREKAESITSVTMDVQYLNSAQVNEVIKQKSTEMLDTSSYEPDLEKPLSGLSIELSEPLNAPSMLNIGGRFPYHMSKMTKNFYKNWGGNHERFHISLKMSESEGGFVIMLPPLGVMYSGSRCMLDLLGIPRKQQVVQGKYFKVVNPSETETLVIEGLKAYREVLEVDPMTVMLQFIMDQNIEVKPDELETEWLREEYFLHFCLRSDLVGESLKLDVPRGYFGVTTPEAAMELTCQALGEYLTSRHLPLDLIDVTINRNESRLELTRNRLYQLNGAVRILMTLDDAPEALKEDTTYGTPLRFTRLDQQGSATYGCLSLEQGASTTKTPKFVPEKSDIFTSSVTRPKNPYYVVLLSADASLNRFSKVLGHLYMVIGYIDSVQNLVRGHSFYLPPMQTKLKVGLLSVVTQKLHIFDKRTEATLCLVSV